MKIKISAVTDVGLERNNNEDAFVFCPNLSNQDWGKSEMSQYIPLGEFGALMVVADGMGGANAGEVASAIAMKSVEDVFSEDNLRKYVSSENVEQLLHLCVKKADEDISKRIWDDPDTAGMGTTIVLCWLIRNVAYIAWCGDSRCYVYNPKSGLKLLTKDHSYVQELVDKGEISLQEAFCHPDNNIITRGLGDVDSEAIPDVVKYNILLNDTFLLCSDGLCGYSTDRLIEQVIEKSYTDVDRCCCELLKLALDNGGHDNICITLTSVIGDNLDSPVPLTNIQRLMIGVKRLFRGR